MDQKKPVIRLWTLLLFSCILSLIAAPLPGTLALDNQKIAVTEMANQVISRKILMDEKFTVNQRMDIEVNDYPIPGPNRSHDPKSPGTGKP